MTLGTTAMIPASIPASTSESFVPADTASTAPTSRAARRNATFGAPLRSWRGTGPHSAQASVGRSRRGSHGARSCSFL
jgi:hypothetical protein